jgi:hypothetical protein
MSMQTATRSACGEYPQRCGATCHAARSIEQALDSADPDATVHLEGDVSSRCDNPDVHYPHVVGHYSTVRYGWLVNFCVGARLGRPNEAGWSDHPADGRIRIVSGDAQQPAHLFYMPNRPHRDA